MDLHQIISELTEERARVNHMIKTFEAMQSGDVPAPSRRGRKSMDKKGRQEVSERMKRYWAKRRAERGPQGSSRLSEASAGGHAEAAANSALQNGAMRASKAQGGPPLNA